MSGAAEAERIADELRRAGVQAALLSSFEDVCYATGFEVPPPIDAGAAFAYGPTLAIATADAHTVLVAPGAYVARAEEQSRADRDVLVAGFGHFDEVDGRQELLGAVTGALADLGLDGHGGRLAIDARTLPAEIAEAVRRAAPSVELVDAGPVLRAARWIKTPDEIARIREAVAANDVGHEALLELAQPGRNELDVMGDVMTRVDRHAGFPVPWAGELVTGPRTGTLRYPGGPVDRVLEAGDTAIMDLSSRIRGYWADCTNTLVVGGGEPTAAQRRYFRAARDAYESAVEQLRPGRRACDAHEAAAAAFARHGLQPFHYTGHQIGTIVNEEPRLVRYDTRPIEAGMVFAVEPGAYGGDEGTGARCERVVVVTEDGPEVLSRFPWGMQA